MHIGSAVPVLNSLQGEVEKFKEQSSAVSSSNVELRNSRCGQRLQNAWPKNRRQIEKVIVEIIQAFAGETTPGSSGTDSDRKLSSTCAAH